jgi:hypothetical protein
MSSSSSFPAHRPALRAAGLLIVVLGSQAAAQSLRPHSSAPSFTSPPRRQTVSPPQPPPALPAEAQVLSPVVLEVVIEGGSGEAPAERRQTVTRTADRVHVAAPGGREWLYLRNPVDPRRVSGLLIDHPTRTIVAYEESDLRNALGIRGWLDVLTLGFDAGALQEMDAGADIRRAHGLVFTRYVARRPDADIREVWWSRSALLPLEVVKGEASGSRVVQISVERTRPGVDGRLLEAPAKRFPGYRQVDFPDWLEGLGER